MPSYHIEPKSLDIIGSQSNREMHSFVRDGVVLGFSPCNVRSCFYADGLSLIAFCCAFVEIDNELICYTPCVRNSPVCVLRSHFYGNE